MKHERLDYRTSDGSMYMDFYFYYLGMLKGWRIYIINDIPYGNRSISGHATHRLHYDGDTYNCICWDGKIRTLDEAKAIASLWADCTARYIKGEGSFDEIAQRLLQR